MKALVYAGPKQAVLQDVPAPVPAEGQVPIDVKYCGICGSDVGIYLGTHPRAKAPLIFGHEFIGTVAEDGKLVVSWNQVNQAYKYWIFRNGALAGWTDGEITFTFTDYDLNDEIYIEGAYRWQDGTRQIKYQKSVVSDILA